MAKSQTAHKDKIETAADEVSTYVQWFEDAESSTQNERRDSERDRDYYDNIQLTVEEIAALKKRKQPVIVVNRIKRKIDFLRGVESQQRSDPKAFPRNPQDEQAAHAATDALRFVADWNRYDVTRSKVWEELLIEGLGGVEVVVEPSEGQDGQDYDIIIRRIPWDRYFRDPHARMADFSDARFHGLVVWMDYDEALEKWPDAKEALDATISSVSTSDTYGDKPQYSVWADSKRRRVRIVQMWHRTGAGWSYCIFTKGGKLEGGESVYRDEKGRPACALVMQSAYVNRENQRYGVVREMIGPQDEINKRRSKALHLISTRQTFGSRSSVKDVDDAKAELAKPDGHLEVESGEFGKDFGVLPTGDMAAAQFQLLQEAKMEIDLMGPNASMQGKSAAEQSGRAIIAQQQGGYVELGPMMDAKRQWDLRVYAAVWDRIRQFWTAEKWIRVTDDERNIRFVGLNKPVTAGEAYLKQMEQQGASPEEIQAAQQQIANEPRAQQVIGVENSTAEMMVDIIVDDAPDSVTIQHEQFQQLVELVKGGVPIPPDVLIEASQLRDKDKLLEKMSSQQQGPTPEQQALEAKMQAEQAKVAADLQAKQQQAQIDAMKAQADLAIKERMAELEAAQAARMAQLEYSIEQQRMALEQERANREMQRDDARFQQEMEQKELAGEQSLALAQQKAAQAPQPAV